MAHERMTIGTFIKAREQAPDTADSPYSVGGIVTPGKDILETIVADDVMQLHGLAPVPGEPVPDLTSPNAPWQPITVPDPERTSPASAQPSLGTSPSRPPAGPIPIPDPPRSHGPADPIIIADPTQTQPAGPEPVPTGTVTDHSGYPGPVQPSDPFVDPGPNPPAIDQSRKIAEVNIASRTVDRPSIVSDVFKLQHADPPEARAQAPDPQSMVPSEVRAFLERVDVPGLNEDPRRGPHSDVGGGFQGSQGWNPRLYARHLLNLSESLGALGIARHALIQTALWPMNVHGKIWNPAALAMPPGLIDVIPATLDVLTGTPGPRDNIPAGLIGSRPGFFEANEQNPFVGDRQLQLAKGVHNDVQVLPNPPGASVIVQGGSIGPQNIANFMSPRLIGAQSQDRSLVDDPLDATQAGRPMVDAALEDRNFDSPSSPQDDGVPLQILGLIKAVETGGGADKDLVVDHPESGLKRVDLRKAFNRLPMATLNSDTALEWRPTDAFRLRSDSRREDPIRRTAFTRGIVPVRFPKETQGFTQVPAGQNPSDVIDDDQAYVPLSFTDVRPYGPGRLRSVYFRPFLTNLSQEFAPSWNKQGGFGRVDTVATYQGTPRTISLGFVVHTFAPEDLPAIHQKMTWLASMVYPEYDQDLSYKSGPVLRMRVGDIISSPNGGLAGIIDSLSFDYSEKLWELTKGSKVPMGYTVSLSFTVLHDVPIGRGADGKFGGLGNVVDGKYNPPRVDTRTTNGTTVKGPKVDDAFDFFAYDDATGKLNEYDPDAKPEEK